jgi:basic membrane protein A
VLIPGKLDDGGWAQSAAQAVAALQCSGRQVAAIGQSQFTPERAFDAAGKLLGDGADLLIGHGHEYIQPFLQLARRHTQARFFAMDKVDDQGDWPENFCCLHQRQDEGAYLCGCLAAHLTRSGKVGFVGGIEVPTQLANGSAFAAGARQHNAVVEVMAEFAGSFEDPERGRRLATDIIERGADVLLHTASETGNGVIEACREHDISVIGYTLDQFHLAPEQMVTSLVVDVLKIYSHKIQEVEAGQFQSGVWTVGLVGGYIDLAPLSESVPEEARAAIDEARQALIRASLNIL